MIVTELYKGQGLGNQLWSYVVTRTLALDRGFDYGIMSPENFKGTEFLNLDFGKEVIGGAGREGGPPEKLPLGILHYYAEKDNYYDKHECDIRDYDPGLLTISDNTKIEGYFQSERLITNHRNEIKNWLQVIKSYDCYDFSSNDICILNIRGGDYKGNNELILSKKYWHDAIRNMLRVKNDLDFIIITDDVKYSQKLLPQYPAYHFSIGKDFAIIKNARYLILANSSFSFFPAWVSEQVKYIIAPKYWARHNVSDGYWACAFNIYRGWMWQDRNGRLFTFEECEEEYARYKIANNLKDLGSRQRLKSSSLISKTFPRIRRAVSRIKKYIQVW